MLQADTRIDYGAAGEMDKMTTIYILLALATLFVECSHKVNTDYILKKSGLLLIFLGCVAGYAGKKIQLAQFGQSIDLIPIGALVYMASNIISSFHIRHKRRASDRRAHG